MSKCNVKNLLEKIRRLEGITRNYLGNGASVYKVNDYMCDFIKHTEPSYRSPTWIITAGKINESYLNYVNNKDSSLYNFFKKLLLIDNSGNIIDFVHAIATLDGYYSTLIPKFWSGWEGDVGTFAQFLNAKTGNSQDYDTLVSLAKRRIGTEGSTISEDDILADIDGHLLFYMIKNNNYKLSEALAGYYSGNLYKSRYSRFVNSMGGKDAFWEKCERSLTEDEDVVLSGIRVFDVLSAGYKKIYPTHIQCYVASVAFADYVLKRC